MNQNDHDLLIKLEVRVWVLEKIGYGFAFFLFTCGALYLYPKMNHISPPNITYPADKFG